MPARRTPALGLAAVIATSWPAPAAAQLAASLSLDSDFRWRGVSLSDGRPAMSLDLSYDHSSGAYVGASGMIEEAPQAGVRFLGDVEYAGFAARSGGGPAWDIGVSHSEFETYSYGDYRVGYTELYAGVTSGRLSAHLYYSPDYFGEGMRTLYAELNGAVAPATDWRLFGHLGALTPLSGGAEGQRERYDLRAGLARAFRRIELRAAFTAVRGGRTPPDEPARQAVVVGASLFF